MEMHGDWRKVDGKVVYTKEESDAFFKLRGALMNEPIMASPDFDKPFEVHCDASLRGLGATLCQKNEGKERVISYASRSLLPVEKAYSIWELESLAAIWSMRLWKLFLRGSPFTLVTDSEATKSILDQAYSKGGGRLMRWSLAASEFDYKLVHRKRARHFDADALSHFPLSSTEPYGEGFTDINPHNELKLWPTDEPTVVPEKTDGRVKKRKKSKETVVNVVQAFFPPKDEMFRNVADIVEFQIADPMYAKWRKNAIAHDKAGPGQLFFHPVDGTLRKKRKDGREDAIVIPESLKACVLRNYHTIPQATHPGRRRTLAAISRFYTWKGLAKSVARWVTACRCCHVRKPPRHENQGEPSVVCKVQEAWHTLALDIVDVSSTPTSEGYKYILTCVDVFTRWVIAIPLRTRKAQDVGDAIHQNILCRYGRVKKIITDEGKEFINASLEFIYRLWSIAPILTGGYRSQANPVERWHRTLHPAMTSLSTKFGADWNRYLQAVVFNTNVSICESTGFAPYYLRFGQEPSLPQDVPLGNVKDDEGRGGTTDIAKFRVRLAATLRKAYEHVRASQRTMAEKNSLVKQANTYYKALVFECGKEKGDEELAMLWEPQQTKRLEDALGAQRKAPSKWTPKWTGPHKVISKSVEEGGATSGAECKRYMIYHCDRSQLERHHVSRLGKFCPWDKTIISTSYEYDSRRDYVQGGNAQEGDLIAIPLAEPFDFGVARVTSTLEDGTVHYQWLGNNNNNNDSTFKPGWIRKNEPRVYYEDQKKHTDHIPYSDVGSVEIYQRDIVIHSFKLTDGQKLPANVMRVILADHRVGGEA